METQTEILELKDCYKFLKDELSNDDLEFIAKETLCNISTIKSYINGNFSDTSLFKIVSPKIVAIGFDIINKKPDMLIEKIKNILDGKTIPNI